MNWGEVNPTHAYYNGSRTSQDIEDPSWNTSIKTRRQRHHLQHWKRIGCHYISLYFALVRNIMHPSLKLLPTVPQTEYSRGLEMPPPEEACLTTTHPPRDMRSGRFSGWCRKSSHGLTPSRVTELDTTVRQRTEEFEVRFEEARDDRAYLGALVNSLYRERIQHHRTALAMDREAVYARIAWTGSEERSAAIEAHVRTLEAQVATLITHATSLQTQLTTALGRIATLEARDPEPQDGPAEAGSSS
ncbi:hypothetical protein Tco_0670245 [Tanacetum coccineum]